MVRRFFLASLQLLLCALAIIDVDIHAIPANEAAVLVVDGRRRYLEPSKCAVGAAQTNFHLPRRSGLLERIPPLFELVRVVPVQ